MNKKTIFILGSNSFSGSNFIKFILKKNFKVIALSRSKEAKKEFLAYHSFKDKIKFFRLDINNNLKKIELLIKTYRPTYFVNFSSQGMVAQSWIWPSHWYETNVLSQVKLIEILKNYKFIKKYIHFTTPEVYGSTGNKIKESFNFNLSTPYAVSRAALDMHLKILNTNYNFPVIFTRAANIYGPYQDLHRIVPKTIISSIRKKRINLHGGGKSIRSFIYVDDVSSALYKIIRKGKIGNCYHISTNKYVSIKNLVKLIIKISGGNYNKLINVSKDRLGKDYKYILNSSKIKKELKWKDTIKLEDGIVKTLNWVKKNKNLIKHSLEYKHKK